MTEEAEADEAIQGYNLSLRPILTVPLSNNAWVYCHQICFSANIC